MISELESLPDNDRNTVIKSDKKAGTFVNRVLVYSYAMHVSAKFEIQVIESFDRDARKKLRQADLHGDAQWKQNRELGKYQRKGLTDMIRTFVDYAKAQGSRGAGHYFTNITKCVNAAVGASDRDETDEETLHLLATAELIAERVLTDGMANQLPYKSIFQALKHEMSAFSGLLPIEAAA